MKPISDRSPATRSGSLRPRLVAAVAVSAIALTACNSTPGQSRVAHDIVQAEFKAGNITEAQQDCMLKALEGYTDSELETIAKKVEGSDESNAAEGKAELDKFEADLAACRN